MRVESLRTDAEDWNELVERADDTTPFHRYEALRVLAEKTNADLYPLVAYNGQEPMGLFPAFEQTRGPFKLLNSPPPFLHTFPLGPVLMFPAGMSLRKREQYATEVVDDCLDWFDEHVDPAYVHVRTDPRFGDVRPFSWRGYEATPYYTYYVDLDRDPETLRGAFSRDARTNIESTDTDAYRIETGDERDVRAIVDQLERRDPARAIDPDFVVDLFRALPDGRLVPYVCRVDGERVGGLITLNGSDVVHRWQGGATPETDLPATDLLDWHVMTEAAERGRTSYDLVGANIPRLCGYKAKFDPDVRVYYTLKRSTPALDAANTARQAVDTCRSFLRI